MLKTCIDAKHKIIERETSQCTFILFIFLYICLVHMNGNGNSGFESEANSISDEATVVKVIL